MTDVYKGQSYHTEKHFENREPPNQGHPSGITGEKWVRSAKLLLMRDKDMLNDILDSLECGEAELVDPVVGARTKKHSDSGEKEGDEIM